MSILIALVLLLCVAVLPAPAVYAESGQATLAHRILQVLHADGTIDDNQYRELMTLADEEAGRVGQGPSASPKEVRAGYDDGFFVETVDEAFKLQIGGRIQTDWALMSEDTDTKALFGELGSGTEFRRARIFVRGHLTENVGFKMEYDFASGETAFTDVFLSFRDVPIFGSVKVGHFKEPFGLEGLTGSRFITFMERGLTSAFAPGRNSGIGVAGSASEDRFTWALGAFRETDLSGRGFGDDSLYNVSGRVTGLPYRNEAGDRLVHLGFSYQHRFRNNDTLDYQARPESHLAPFFADTGSLLVDQVNQYQPELAVVWGPFSLQAEGTIAVVDLDGTQSADFHGHYLYASYFLTGEHRAYDPAVGYFRRMRPRRNAARGKGAGAWELGARYSHLKLDDASVSGGELSDLTLGLNWYLNPFVRVMFNYVNAHLNDVGRTHIWQTRLQADF